MNGYITIEQLSKDLQELIEKAQNCTLDGFYNKSEIDAKEKYWLSLVGEKIGLDEGYTKEQFDERINEIKEQILTKANADTHYDKPYIDKVVDDFEKQYQSKADKDNVYTREEVNDRLKTLDLSTKANIDDVYTKEDIEKMLDELKKLLNTKMNRDSVYTKEELDAKFAELGQKANIDDIYDKNTVDRKIQEIKDSMSKLLTAENVYTKSEIDRMFGILETIVDKNDVYTKEVIDSKVETINTELAKKLEDTTRYTKSEVDSLFNQVKRDIERLVDWSNYYTKAQVNDRIKVLLSTSDIIDNLTSNATDKGLSANQGRILNGKIEDLKNYASDAKTRIAAAITSQKVNASSNDSWNTLDDKVRQIQPYGKDLSEYVLTDVIIPKDMGYPIGLMFKDRIVIIKLISTLNSDSSSYTVTITIELHDKYGELLNSHEYNIQQKKSTKNPVSYESLRTKDYIWLLITEPDNERVRVYSYDYNLSSTVQNTFNVTNERGTTIYPTFYIGNRVILNICRKQQIESTGDDYTYVPYFGTVVIDRTGSSTTTYLCNNYEQNTTIEIVYASKYLVQTNYYYTKRSYSYSTNKTYISTYNKYNMYRYTDFSRLSTDPSSDLYNKYDYKIFSSALEFNYRIIGENDIDAMDTSCYAYTKQLFKILIKNGNYIYQYQFSNNSNSALSEVIPYSRTIAVNDTLYSCGLYYNDKWCVQSNTPIYYQYRTEPFYTNGYRWMSCSIYNDVVYVFFRRIFGQTDYRTYVFEYRRRNDPKVDYNSIPYYQNMDQNKDGLFKYIWLEDEQGWEIQGGFIANGSRIVITDTHEGKPIIKANNIVTKNSSSSYSSKIYVDYLSKNLKYFSGVFKNMTISNDMNIDISDTVEDLSYLFYYTKSSYTTKMNLPKSLKTLNYAFYYAQNGTKIIGDMTDDYDVNMEYAFCGCSENLIIGHLSNKITNMYCCFANSSIQRLQNIPTSVKNLYHSFASSTLIELLDLPNTVENMTEICYGCNKLLVVNKLPSGNLTNVTKAFYNCQKLTTINDNLQDFLNSNKNNIKDYTEMFRNCSVLNISNTLDFSIFDGIDNINFSYMFYYCSQLSIKDINLKMKNYSNLHSTFYYVGATTFKCIDLEGCLINSLYRSNTIVEMNISYIKLINCLISGSTTSFSPLTSSSTESYLLYPYKGSIINVQGDITLTGTNIGLVYSDIRSSTIDGKTIFEGATITFKRLMLNESNESSGYVYKTSPLKGCIIDGDEIICDGDHLSKYNSGIINNAYIKRLDRLYVKSESFNQYIIVRSLGCESIGDVYIEHTNPYNDTSGFNPRTYLCIFENLQNCKNLNVIVKGYVQSLFNIANELENINVSAYNFHVNSFASSQVPNLRTLKITYLDISPLNYSKKLIGIDAPKIKSQKLESIDIIYEGSSDDEKRIELYEFLRDSDLSNLSHLYIDTKILISSCSNMFRGTNVTNTIDIFKNRGYCDDTVYLSYMYYECTSLEGQQTLYLPQCKGMELSGMFSGCINLTGSYTIPENATYIARMFYNTKIENLTIPYCPLITTSDAFSEIVYNTRCKVTIDSRNLVVTEIKSKYDDQTMVLKELARKLFGSSAYTDTYLDITLV